jgi:hypothetical protein
MAGKPVISLSTGLEDLEKVTVAFLVAVGAADSVRPTLIFLGPTKRSNYGNVPVMTVLPHSVTAGLRTGGEVMFGSMRRRFWAESVSAASVAVLALVTVVWPDWIEIVTDSAPDGGSGALERAVVGVLAATAILLAAVARAEWRRAAVAAR